MRVARAAVAAAGTLLLDVAFVLSTGFWSAGCSATWRKNGCVTYYGKDEPDVPRRYFKALQCPNKPDKLLCDSDRPLPNKECQ
jgi:hypothetical protein